MMLCGMGKYGRVMTQYIGIVYDVIFLLLVLGAAETGRRRGFASGLVSLIGSVAGIIGGTYGTRVWAGGIYDKYVASHVTDVVADTLEKTGGDLAQAIHALTFLPQSIQQKLIDTVSAASSNAVPQVVNALEPLFLPVIQAVVFLSVWIVVRVLCRMLGRVLRGINAIPGDFVIHRWTESHFGLCVRLCQRLAELLDLVHSAVGGGKPDRRQAGIFDHSHPEPKRDLWTFGKPEPVFDPLLINNI